ncbi:MAG TPA: RNA-guided endonuclease IscB [Spirochaetia bacterium]|nr:RNA-guided endonuclease IscB [Spirochaetia bacterium]
MEGAVFMVVPVQNNDGSPLSPCHPARARILLKQEKATLVTVYPFVIRLTFQVENPAFPPSRITMDEGKTVGLGVVKETGVANVAVCKVEMKTRGEEISGNLEARKALRGARRKHRNRQKDHEGQVKIQYRHGQEYPPSIRADVDAKVNAVRRLMKMYPVTEIVLEPVKLDIFGTINPGAQGTDYQTGPGRGIEAGSSNEKRRLAILKRDGYRCLCCGHSVTDETARIHHFVQRKDGGSKRYDIQGTLCETCHTSVSTGDLALAFDLDSYPSIRAVGRSMHGRFLLERELGKLGVPVTIRYGYETKALRDTFGLSKSHANDAVAAGCNPDKPLVDEATAYRVKLHARHGGRKLFDANPGVGKYRSDARCQPGVDQSRMGVDEHDQAENKKNRSYRRHVRNRYYKLLRNTGRFNGDLLPGKRGLNEVFTANRAILLTKDGPVLVKNQQIGQWKYNGSWPARNKVIERYDLVRTSKGDIGIVTSIMSNCTVKVEFTKKRAGRKANFSMYKPDTLTILQKTSSQTWVIL